MEKMGLDSSNLKTAAEREDRFLGPGESQKIVLPKELDLHGDCRIEEWFFEKGQVVRPGDVVGAVADKELRFEFESYMGGKLNYHKEVGQKVAGGSVIAEIIGF